MKLVKKAVDWIDVRVGIREIVEKEFLVMPLIPAKSAGDPGVIFTTTRPRSTP